MDTTRIIHRGQSLRLRAGHRICATVFAPTLAIIVIGIFMLPMQTRAASVDQAVEESTASQSIAKGTGFAIPRHVIANGGGDSSGGVFRIQGTIGQADADPLQPSTGGVYGITGGFWPGNAAITPSGDALFANGFEG